MRDDPLIATATAAVLPSGFRLREFEEEDREPLVALRNEGVHEMQRQTAEEWRYWDRLMPDASRLRMVLDAPGERAAGAAFLSNGGVVPHPDGAVNGGVFVSPRWRGRGVGSALVTYLEDEARRRAAPRWLSSVNEAHEGALDWAKRRGFQEIGRRIESYVELAGFDPGKYATERDRPRASGVRLATMAELIAGGEEARESIYRRTHEAEAEMWEDIPWPSPVPHMPFEKWRVFAMADRTANDATVLALAGDDVVGLTLSALSGTQDGMTVMTGTRRAWRGKGLAFALKVEALARAKARGLRAMLTTNDEPNKPMRGINARLGYRPLPAEVMLEKRLP